MPGRRSRAKNWTHKKSKSAHLQGGEPTAPKAAVWEGLEQHGSFIVLDEDNQEHVFKIGDDAAVVPAGKYSQDVPLDQHWMVRVKGIRSKPNGEVWVKINWFYSPQEVSEKVPTFDASKCAKYERIYSHHSEIVSALTFEALVAMVEFLEDDADQPCILQDQFFNRYYLETNREKFNVLQYTSDGLETLGAKLCRCGELYNPEDSDSRVMHWCPRPGCRRAYHRSCLIEDTHCHAALKGRNNLVCVRLSSSADTDEAVMIPGHEILRRIPESLVFLAAQPMVRGGAHGVAGNVAIVVRARRVVHAALSIVKRESFSGSDLSSDSEAEGIWIVDAQLDLDLDLYSWYEDPGFASWQDAIVEARLSSEAHPEETNGVFVCPTCGGAL
ncbi:hypothetical protein C8F04DRAFT_1125067 [Mycena alexandri]|uniref:BAH domain-containing protein n=1 Tax=Mycena alexandri TaxID=1745969 RepID=A0AAD6WVU5_9AGAR|nr:hypothetical protein C8F04DRAFT_1125067 [Mycena alexandri]